MTASVANKPPETTPVSPRVLDHKAFRRRLITDPRRRSQLLDQFMVNPDRFCERQGLEILKDDIRTTIGVTSFDGLPVVVKRYNGRNSMYRVKRAFRQSRAEHCYHNGYRLMACGIATPMPIAAVEERFGPIHRRSWFLSEHVPGPTLNDWFANRDSLEDKDSSIVTQVADCFARMKRSMIGHGDTKDTNWLVHKDRVYLIDLDAMRVYRNPTLHEQRLRKDKARFLRNFDDSPTIRQRFDDVLSPIVDP